MNDNTLVVVCGYSGDGNQVKAFLPLYMHHKCPVMILSPEDAPIVESPFSRRNNIICKQGGKKAYVGQLSLDRQRRHLEMMLDTPYKYFLANDADSFCIASEIPRYVYNEDVLWSNVVSDEMHVRPVYKLPRLAFQPPYFMSRQVIEKLLTVAGQVVADPQTPFIDHYMVQLACGAGVPYKGYVDGPDGGVSCPTNNYDPGLNMMSELVRLHGRVFLHSIKTAEVMRRLVSDRVSWRKAHGAR